MTNVKSILDQLAATSGRIEKQNIIRAHASEDVFRAVLAAALNPYIQYYQRKPLKPGERRSLITLADALFALKGLSERYVTGNSAIRYLQDLIDRLSPDDAEVLQRVVLKDLRCGIQASTVNSVIPGLIPEYSVMLCSKMDKKRIQSMTYPVIVQEKCDGQRVNILIRDGEVELRTRSGRVLDILGFLDSSLFSLFAKLVAINPEYKDGAMLDGEMLVVDKNDQLLPRKVGNGIINKAGKGTISKAEADRIVVTLWDAVPITRCAEGRYDVAYVTRFAALMDAIAGAMSYRVFRVDSKIARNYEEVEQFYQSQLGSGKEGAVVKDPNGIWMPSRVAWQVKMKAEEEADLEIVGFEEGTGQFKGSLGAFLVATRDRKINVKVGSGFTPAQRKSFWEQRTQLIGWIVAVKYNARIINQATGEESLFLPIFIELREDKSVADNSEDLK